MNVSMRTALLLAGGMIAFLGHVVLAVTFLAIVSGALYGAGAASALGDLAKHRRSVRPDRPVKFGECPPDAGRVLTTTEFERRCDVLLTPPELEVPEPPDPLPMGLRDAGFRATNERRSRAAKDLLDAEDERMREMHLRFRGLGGVPIRRAETDLSVGELRTIGGSAPYIANRQFEGYTHCPEGHIGVHYIGETVVYEGESMIRRECRFEKCGATWLERSGLPAPEPKGDESFAALMKTVRAMPAKARDTLIEKMGSAASPVDENEADWRDLGREVRHAKDREFERRIKRDALRKEVQAREREIAKAKAKAARQSRAVSEPPTCFKVKVLDTHGSTMGTTTWDGVDDVHIDVLKGGTAVEILIANASTGEVIDYPLSVRDKVRPGDKLTVKISGEMARRLES